MNANDNIGMKMSELVMWISEFQLYTWVMLNSLVFRITDYVDSQWAIFVRTHWLYHTRLTRLVHLFNSMNSRNKLYWWFQQKKPKRYTATSVVKQMGLFRKWETHILVKNQSFRWSLLVKRDIAQSWRQRAKQGSTLTEWRKTLRWAWSVAIHLDEIGLN